MTYDSYAASIFAPYDATPAGPANTEPQCYLTSDGTYRVPVTLPSVATEIRNRLDTVTQIAITVVHRNPLPPHSLLTTDFSQHGVPLSDIITARNPVKVMLVISLAELWTYFAANQPQTLQLFPKERLLRDLPATHTTDPPTAAHSRGHHIHRPRRDTEIIQKPRTFRPPMQHVSTTTSHHHQAQAP